MAKYLDENGAEQLNLLLANKFNSKMDCIDLTSPVRIWDLDDGAYKLPTGCVVYYYGATNTSNTFTISTTGWLFVTHYSTTYKFYYILCADNLATRYLYNGYVTSTDGSSKNFNLGSTYLTKISSYVKNNLTYSTSNTTYALSAYQGYLLNQNKADKTAFTGTDGNTDGTSGLVPAPLTTDNGKFLKADGTWTSIPQRFKLYELTNTDVFNNEEVTDTTDSNTLDEMLADMKDNDILGILKVPLQNTYTYYIAQFISVYNNKYTISLVGKGTQFLTFYQGNTYWQIQATTMFDFLPTQFSVGLVDVDWTDTTTQTISTQYTIDELDDIQNKYSFDDIIYVYDINSNDTEAKLDNVSFEIDSMTGDYTLCGLVNIEDTTYRLQLISSEGDWTAKVTPLGSGGSSPQITASTTDLTAGTSPLASGTYYFVYE